MSSAEATALVLGDWRAVKLNDHCWRLQKRAGKDAKTEWNDIDFYPATAEAAASALWERAARDMGGEYDLGDPAPLLARLAALKGSLRAEAAVLVCDGRGRASWQ